MLGTGFLQNEYKGTQSTAAETHFSVPTAFPFLQSIRFKRTPPFLFPELLRNFPLLEFKKRQQVEAGTLQSGAFFSMQIMLPLVIAVLQIKSKNIPIPFFLSENHLEVDIRT